MARVRKTQYKFSTAAWPVAVRFQGAAMQLRKTSRKTQSNTEPALHSMQRAIPLSEQLEDLSQGLGRHANSRVANFDDALRLVCFGRQPDLSAVAGVIRSVIEQIGQELGHPR